jgi:1,2-diacylglycerol 3-alpha-glucosyltransferase
MKIIHACLSCFFIDDRAYQENELVTENVRQGHEVLVLASTYIHGSNGKGTFCEPGEYYTAEGAKVIRLPYSSLIPKKLASKLGIHPGVLKIIKQFEPDAILFHGICGWELLTFARYCHHNPTIFYADTHTDEVNSARTFLSKWLLHYFYYKSIIRRALPEITKILCISSLTLDFAREIYGVPSNKLEFYPLGGHPVPKLEYLQRRNQTRQAYGISDKQILFIQSGKQTHKKHLQETLIAFNANADPRFYFLIAGVLMEDVRMDVEALIKSDHRIKMLTWLDPKELEDLLCAADVYLQPGSQSSTMQTSLCCHCAVVLENWESHQPYVDGNGWLINSPSELMEVFQAISEERFDLQSMQDCSERIALQTLDYSILSHRFLS